jgi:hypothetical protein
VIPSSGYGVPVEFRCVTVKVKVPRSFETSGISPNCTVSHPASLESLSSHFSVPSDVTVSVTGHSLIPFSALQMIRNTIHQILQLVFHFRTQDCLIWGGGGTKLVSPACNMVILNKTAKLIAVPGLGFSIVCH